jgi:mono/diheme cytochrome c family protein
MCASRRLAPAPRDVTRFLLVAVLLVTALTARAVMAGQQSPADTPHLSGSEGFYSVAQAERGARVYASHCERCHGVGLFGDLNTEVPALVDDEFLVPWEKSTVGDLLTRISTTMPGNRPGSLSRAEYLDVVAYLLRANRFPAGERELPDDPAALARLAIGRP